MSETLAHYSFLPFVRQGLSVQIKEKDTLGASASGVLTRASVEVEARVTNDGSTTKIPKTLRLLGPGDITGIQSRAIVRSEPATGVQDFEPNYLAYLEFYEEDFVWRYTPAAPDGSQLRPWLCLLVLKADEFSLQGLGSGSLPAIELLGDPSELFPDPEETWAWAHVHVNSDLDPDDSGDSEKAMTELRSLLADDPDLAVCRLLSPRKLEANARYTAFLVPAFETGRLAGLGELVDSTDAQLPSWGPLHSEAPTTYPVYHTWSFGTSSAGDFETLVEKLQPVELPEDIGERPMDLQESGYGLSYTNGDGSINLPGSLRAPSENDDLPLSFDGGEAFGKDIADRVNIANDLQGTGTVSSGLTTGDLFGYSTAENIADDPVVSPSLYGRWHAKANEVDRSKAETPDKMNWLHELNLDPRYRAAAGMGAEVIRRNQESYMQACWEQIGDVIEANKKLKSAQLAKETSNAMFRKHLKTRNANQLVNATGPVQAKIKHGVQTVARAIADSSTSNLVASTTFTKLFRPSSTTLANISSSPSLSLHTDLLTGIQTGSISTVPQRVTSPNLRYVSRSSMYSLVSYTSRANVSQFNFTLDVKGLTRMSQDSNKEAVAFKSAVTPFKPFVSYTRWRDTAAAPAVDAVALQSSILERIDPLQAIRRKHTGLLSQSKSRGTADRIEPIMAHPALNVPLYEPLAALSSSYLIPGIDKIPNNSISLLEVNRKFIEAFLVGANHEMMRELLWREYPTDQRGTPFLYFWDSADYGASQELSEADHASEVRDINKIHHWSKASKLGSHNPRKTSGDQLVLVVRGDLLRKYPNTVIYANRAKWGGSFFNKDYDGQRKLGSEIKEPIFSATISPDLTLVGFDLTAEEAIGNREGSDKDPGWFFALMERPGEVHFGLDTGETTSSKVSSWQDLTWGHVKSEQGSIEIGATGNPGTSSSVDGVVWGENAASMASILYQDPVLMAVHASKMLPQTDL